MKTKTQQIKELKLKVLQLHDPEAYGRKLYKRNGRFCIHQGCGACIRTGGIVPKEHLFAGPLCPLDFKREK